MNSLLFFLKKLRVLIFFPLFCIVSFFYFISVNLFLFRSPSIFKTLKNWSRFSLFCMGCSLQVSNREALLKIKKTGACFAAMHTSLLDTFAYPAILPEGLTVIARSQLKSIPIYGSALPHVGCIFVERNNSLKDFISFLKTVEKIKNPAYLFIHPSGTRIKDGDQLSFKKGFIKAAEARNIPIVPIASYGGSSLWPRDKFLPIAGTLKIKIGDPIFPEEGKSLKYNLAKIEVEIGRMLDEFRGEYS